jgi:hypothetical protein
MNTALFIPALPHLTHLPYLNKPAVKLFVVTLHSICSRGQKKLVEPTKIDNLHSLSIIIDN